MNFLHASQNESAFRAMEGSRLCSANLGQFDEVVSELATLCCRHHPANREALLQFIHLFLARPFLGHRVAAAATLKQLLLGAGDQKLASVTNAAVATNVLGCTGDSHAAVRKQDVRGFGHFVTIWKQAAASTLGKDFAGRLLSAACAGLRDESGSVPKEAVAAVHRACMAEGRRKWWRRLLDSGAQMRSLCDAANPGLREASLDLLSRLCLPARSADHGALDEVRSKLPPADNELLLVSCLSAVPRSQHDLCSRRTNHPRADPGSRRVCFAPMPPGCRHRVEQFVAR